MSAIIDQVTNHLEFLGYEITRRENEVFYAKHISFFNLIFKEYPYGVLFTAFLGLNSSGKSHLAEVYPRLNAFNRSARVCRAYLDKDMDMAVESCFPIYYEKIAFGNFMETVNGDFRLISNEEIKLNSFLE
jgi:hypothetical protein